MSNTDDQVNHDAWGTDGIQPVWQPNALWKPWALHEIYTGEVGKNRYVPKVLDHVVDPISNRRWYVESVTPNTLIPTLVPLGTGNTQVLSSQDLLFAEGPGWAAQVFRVFIDDTVFPYRLDLDNFLRINKSQAAYVKFYKGSIYNSEPAVAFVMDSTGEIISDKIGLDLVQSETGAIVNHHSAVVRPCHTNQKFQDGDSLMVVVYSQEGHMLSNTPVKVVNSNFMRQQNAPTRVIKAISLKSPFLSPNDPHLIQLPTNWNKSTVNLTGVVHYNDGSTVELPVDGRKFTLHGWDMALSSIPGHPFDLSLHYSMDASEAANPEVSAFNNGINREYRGITVEANNSYSVKLFGFPVWDPLVVGFRLKWFMTSLDRSFYRDVTPYVKIAANSAAFDGHLFGQLQRLQFTLNLRDVVPTYKPFNHTQICDFTLYGSPVDFPTPWTVKPNTTDNVVYGASLNGTRVANGINISSGIATQEEWLERFYMNLRPISETPEDLLTLMQPTKFSILFNNVETEFSLEDWNKNLVLTQVPSVHDTVFIVYKRASSTGDLVLAVGALSIAQ